MSAVMLMLLQQFIFMCAWKPTKQQINLLKKIWKARNCIQPVRMMQIFVIFHTRTLEVKELIAYNRY